MKAVFFISKQVSIKEQFALEIWQDYRIGLYSLSHNSPIVTV